MSDTTLERFHFSEEHLKRVAGFYCGDAPWEKEVADWIKSDGDPGALFDLKKRRVRGIWLYASKQDGLVGFGSLGPTNWKYPEPDSPPVKHLHIPWVGLRHDLQGRPTGVARDLRYSYQIMGDLIAEAANYTQYPRLLSLYVHHKNQRAIAFYQHLGFVFVPHQITDSGQYRGMIAKF